MNLRRSRLPLFFLLAFITSGTFEHIYGTTVEGKVDLGDPPVQRRRKQSYSAAEINELDPPPPRIGVVYLRGPNQPGIAKDPPTATMLQKGLQFDPPVLPIQVGTSVKFPNADETYHNVFSYSQAKSFDLGRYHRGDAPREEIFPVPGEVELFCEVHDHMRSIILVLETPLYTSTDPEGNFQLENVPPGEYTLYVWLRPGLVNEFPVTVPDQDSVTLTLGHDE